MHQDTHGWLSVHDVAKGMGLTLDDATAWAIGAEIAKAWSWQVGTPPLKDLRTKKSGRGSHTFALYPPGFQKRMELIIRAYHARDADQPRLL